MATIHLKYINLYGYEREKDMKKIMSIIETLRTNPTLIPAINILKIDDKNYRLIKNKDGGHHRALASLLTNAPLNIKLIGNSPESVDKLISEGWFNISDSNIGGEGIYTND